MKHRDKNAVALAMFAIAIIGTISMTFASLTPVSAAGAKMPLQTLDSRAAAIMTVTSGKDIGERNICELDIGGCLDNGEMPDNDELFVEYANRLLGISPHTIRASKNLAGNSLTGSARKIYDYLKQEITKVANGEQTSTTFSVPVTQFMEKLEFSKTELDVSSEDISARILQVSDTDISNIYYALLYDCPYELYWHNKKIEIQRPKLMDHGATVSIAADDALIFYFNVDTGYAAEGAVSYQVNPGKINAAKIAAATADEIVRQAASKTDYDKLAFYCRRICDLTSYNYSAAAKEDSNARDPWQLIYVFDQDPNTSVVCEGYAKAFQYLCDKTDFEDDDIYSYLVSGVMSDGGIAGGHMWNMVHMGSDGNYFVDVTNCDTGTVGEGNGLFLVGYTYGNVKNGYRIQIQSGQTIAYTYAQNMPEIYSAEALSLQEGRCHNWEMISAVDATCTVPGQKIFRCRDCGATKSEKTAAAGHAYEASFSWSDNMSGCIVTLTCKNNSAHQKSAEATVTSEITEPSTCVSKGTAIYTATVSIDGQTYQEQKTEKNIDINSDNHIGGTEIRNQKKATSKAAGYTGDTYCKSCNAKIAEGKGVTVDGNFLDKIELADIPAVITVESDAAGTVLRAQAELSQMADSCNKVTLSGNLVSQVTEAAGTENVTVTMTVKDTEGADQYKVIADVKDLAVGNKLNIYQLDQKTGEYIMVNAKTYTVGSSGNVTVAMNQNSVFQLIDAEQSAKIDRAISKTVKVKKASASVQKGKSTRIRFSSRLNMENVRKITYTSSNKEVAKVSANGRIVAENTGTATIKARVTLKNGNSKIVSMKVKVKP